MRLPRVAGGAPLLVLNLLLLATACGILFYRHQGALFEDSDALGLLFMVKSAFTWQPTLLSEAWHPMSLLGSSVLFNAALTPPVLGLHAFSGLAGRILCFTILAFELFLGMYALCRSFALRQGLALAAAWLCVNLVLPLHQHPVPLGPVYTVWPLFGHSAALIMFTLACLRLCGRTATTAGSLAAVAGFVVFSTLQVITSVALSPLSVPPTIIGAACLLLLAQNRRELAWKLCAAFCVFAVMATGPLAWTLGKIMYSARYVFNAEMLTTPPLPFLVSAVFLNGYVPKFALAITLLGALAMLRSTRKDARYAAAAFLFYVLLHAAYGAAYLSGRYDFRSLPHPIYLDYTTSPLHAVFFGYFFVFAYRALATRYTDQLNALKDLCSRRSLSPGGLLFLAALAYFLIQGVSAFGLKQYKAKPALTSSPIVDELRQELGLVPGSDFRGRVTSLLMCGALTEQEAAAGLVADCAGSTHLAWRPGLHNTHTLSNLWFFDVPTLDGYEQTLPVTYYLTYNRLASGAPWINNYSGISRLNIPLLAASGVRFFITARPVAAAGAVAKSVLRLDSKGIAGYDPVNSDAAFSAATGNDGMLCLYEVQKANLGQYSPTSVQYAETIPQALAAMGAPDFDYARRIVLHERPADLDLSALVPGALLAPLRVEKSGYRVRATSDGLSILLLPFEYTHGMAWLPDPGSTGEVRLLRANLTMTAFVFRGAVSGRVLHAFGPWTNPTARLEDFKDLRRMGLSDFPTVPLTGSARYIPLNL